MNKPIIYIGVDAGTHTGLAVWNSQQQKFLSIETVAIHKAMEIVHRHFVANDSILVRVEDARKRKWFGNADAREKRSGSGIREGIGAVKRDAKIWEDFLTDNKIPFEMVAPKNNRTKLSAESFAAMTKWEERTNEHGRDAAMMIFGIGK